MTLFRHEATGIMVAVTDKTTEAQLEEWFVRECEEQAFEIDVFQTTDSFCQLEEDEISFWGDDGIFRMEKVEFSTVGE